MLFEPPRRHDRRSGERRSSSGRISEGDRVPEVPSVGNPALFSQPRRSALWPTVALLPLLIAGGCNRPHDADVVATVNGHPIQRSVLERTYRGNLGNAQHEPSLVQSEVTHLEILRQLIDDEIQQQRAAKLNLVATDEEVDAKLAELKAPYTQEEFDRQLKARNMTLEDVKRDVRRGLTSEKLMNKEINSKINITDADVTRYYSDNKAEFNLVEPQFHLAEIVVTSAPSQQPGNLQNNKASNDAEARKKIEALHTRLESGEDFGALAANFSEQASTASSGGDMGSIPESQLRQETVVYAALQPLKAGQITPVLPILDANHRPAGYAIYKLISKEAAGQREINDPRVQQFIRSQLRDSRAQLLQKAYYEMLRDQSHVENFYAEEIFKKGAQ
jgi:peptidyl-prolyl cis-trans isomerase SurA